MMHISENRRYLVSDDGIPFFYLADTAWALFYKVWSRNIDERDHVLVLRAA